MTQMKEHLLSSIPYLFECCMDLFLIHSFLGKKWKDLCTIRLLLLPAISLLNHILSELFPNVFGWFIAFPICLITYCIILKAKISDCLFAFMLSFTLYGLTEGIAVVCMPKNTSSLNSSFIELIGTGIIALIFIALSLLPLHRFYNYVSKGNLTFKLILSYACLLFMVAVAISKVDSIDALVVLPMTVTFMVILLLADIMVLNQQRTITIQQQDIKDYQTYEPMAHDLISDILGKQHDFNNQMNAIRMLPYTYKDYDSLSEAIANYSTFLEEEFNESELLKINLPVVAGFVFSKIKEAEQKGRLISVKIKNRSLITPVPEYDLIRILGILIDNAIEATEPGHTFSLILDSKNEHIRFQTKNEGGEISSELRKKMFVRGYSTKTSAEVRTTRGQGLPNLKELVDHYNGKIYLDNETFHEHTWICFTVEL